MLATVQWSCIDDDDYDDDDDDDDDDDIRVMSHCADICHTLTDCGSCLSAGAQCVWSVVKQQVCLFVATRCCSTFSFAALFIAHRTRLLGAPGA